MPDEIKPPVPSASESIDFIMDGLGYGDSIKNPAPVEKVVNPVKVTTEPTEVVKTVPPKEEEKARQEAKAKADAISKEVARQLLENKSSDEAARKSQEEAAASTKQKPDPDKDLSEEDLQNLRVARFMEQDGGKTGRESEYRGFLKAEQDYVAKWLKDNPGESFDGDSSDHEEFYDEATPKWIDGQEFRRSETEMIASDRAARIIAKEREAQMQKEHKAIISKNANQAAVEGAREIMKAFDPKAKSIDEIRQRDPVSADTVIEVANETAALMATAEQLMDPRTRFRSNHENPMHAELLLRVKGYEDEMSGSSESMDWEMADGVTRKFATLDQWNSMTKKDREGHYTAWLHPEIVRPLLVRDGKNKLQEAVSMRKKSFDEAAERMGWQRKEAVPNSKTVKATETPAVKAKTRSNPASMGDEKVSASNAVSKDSSDHAKLIQDALYG